MKGKQTRTNSGLWLYDMERIKIGEVCDILNGYSFKSEKYVDSGIRIIRIANVQKGYIEDNSPAFYPSDSCGLEKYILEEGDLLMSLTGNVGRVAILDKAFLPAALNQRVACLRMKGNSVSKKYLFHLLNSDYFEQQCIHSSKGVAQKNMSTEWLKEYEIPLYSTKMQNKIIATLDTLQSLITHRKQQLEKLDELVKARFVEMFMGKDYPILTLDSLSVSKGEYGAQSSAIEYDSTRPRYVRITDINDDGTLNDDTVSSSNIDDDIQYKLSYGDFLFARMGATVGKSYAYKSGNQIYAGYLIRYKLNLEKILPDYLYSYTRLNEYWEWVKLNQSGAAQPGINAKKYGSLQIPVAPIHEQNQFAAFVTQVDKSKVAVQKALDEAQLLFDSLMQEYFG